ncbi:MAG: VWA domain-containing protein [Tahibacter sp.]
MTDFIQNFHFLRPWWFLALVALPLIWNALSRDRDTGRAWARVVDAHLLPHLLVGAPRSTRVPMLLLGIAWCIGVVALAGPAWERLPSPLYRNQAGHVIALELAPSMLASDLKPNRLTRARYKIRDLLARIGDGQTALLGYAGEAFVVAPLTDDANTVRHLIDALDPGVMPVAGNATGSAIRRGVQLLQQAGANHGDLILVADAVSADATVAATEAWNTGVRVSVLAVGTTQGAPVSLPQGDFLKDSAGNIVLPKLDAQALHAVAEAGHGRYVELSNDAADLDALAGALAAASTGSVGPEVTTSDLWRDRGPWLVLLLLPFAASGFRRGWLMVLPVAVLMAQASPAQASGLADLWRRPDQQAWEQLQNGDAKQAASLARDPALRGAAAYRAGDFATTVDALAPLPDADAAYNRGNALASEQQFEQAIAAYDEALRRDPRHADALANRKAVQEWMKQQEQEKQQQQKKKDEQGKEGDKSKDHQGQPQDSSKGNDSKDGQQGDQGSPGQPSPGENPSSDKKEGTSPKPQQKSDSTGDKSDLQAGQNKDDSAESDQQKNEKKQAFEKAMNQAVQDDKVKSDQPPQSSTAAAPAKTDAEREHDQATQQWLLRVPDDPGGLLRRKFQLEHERRQRQGAAGGQ